MRVSDMIRSAQGEEECPEGQKWCPIQKKCVTPPGRGLGRSGQGDVIKKKLVEFFKANPNPDDNQVHQLAAKLKISPHDLETHIYALLSDLLKRSGE